MLNYNYTRLLKFFSHHDPAYAAYLYNILGEPEKDIRNQKAKDRVSQVVKSRGGLSITPVVLVGNEYATHSQKAEASNLTDGEEEKS